MVSSSSYAEKQFVGTIQKFGQQFYQYEVEQNNGSKRALITSCCDPTSYVTKKNDCHFKGNVLPYKMMIRKEHADYKQFHFDYIHPVEINYMSVNLYDMYMFQLYSTIMKRLRWMRRYLKTDCYKADANGRNHEGMIVHLLNMYLFGLQYYNYMREKNARNGTNRVHQGHQGQYRTLIHKYMLSDKDPMKAQISRHFAKYSVDLLYAMYNTKPSASNNNLSIRGILPPYRPIDSRSIRSSATINVSRQHSHHLIRNKRNAYVTPRNKGNRFISKKQIKKII